MTSIFITYMDNHISLRIKIHLCTSSNIHLCTSTNILSQLFDSIYIIKQLGHNKTLNYKQKSLLYPLQHTGIYIHKSYLATCANIFLIDKMQTYEIRWFIYIHVDLIGSFYEQAYWDPIFGDVSTFCWPSSSFQFKEMVSAKSSI